MTVRMKKPEKKRHILGKLEVETNNSGLEAWLVFTPREEGPIWANAQITELIKNENIIEGFEPETIDEVLDEFMGVTDNQASKLIAKGLAPELPILDKVEWEEIFIPEYLSDDAENCFSEAADPQIYRKRVQKIKTKKKVKKKGLFAFGNKEEDVSFLEKKEIAERVFVEPAIVKKGYSEEGKKIASIIPGKPGKNGISVYGTSVPPVQITEPAIYPGDNIEQRGRDLYALETGFIRIGKNWVDLIPFESHKWSIRLTKDRATCLLDFTPGDKNALIPGGEVIIAEAEKQGYPREKLKSQTEIDNLLRDAASEGRKLEGIPVSAAEDAKIEIEVTPNELKAYLNLKKGTGNGKPLLLKEVGNVLKNCKLKIQKYDVLKNDIIAFYRSPDVTLHHYLLAEGKPPQRGEDREFNFKIDFLDEKEASLLKERIKKQSDKFTDLSNLEEFPLDEIEEIAKVEEQQYIASFSKESKGLAGRNVYGESIAGIPGNDPAVEVYDHLQIKHDDVIATASGLLAMTVKNDETHLRVIPYQEQKLSIKISADRMKAFLTMSPGKGPVEAITEERIHKAIKDRGIVAGIKDDQIKFALKQTKGGFLVEEEIIAEGIYPADSLESRLKFYVTFASGKKATMKEGGQADFKTQDNITTVRADELIAEILPAMQEVRDGQDVFGKTIPAQNVNQDVELDAGKNIRKEVYEGGIKYYAEKSGELVYKGKRLEISQSYIIKTDVGVKTGNIKFSGDVQVKGGVQDGYYILSGGGIKVGGTIGSALLSAENDIKVDGGIKGNGKAVLRAKGGISCSFAEEANLLSVQDITIKNSCINCKIKSNGKLRFTGEKAVLFGGTILCQKGIILKQLGSPNGIHTVVSFGQDYLIEDRIEQEKKEMKKLKDQMTQLDGLMLRAGKENDNKKLVGYRRKKLKMVKVMETRSKRLFDLMVKYEEHFPGEIHVSGSVHPGTVIESHGRTLEVTSEKKNTTFVFNAKAGHVQEKTT